MKLEDITKDTKIKELSKEYPWLIDEVKKLSDRAAAVPSAEGRRKPSADLQDHQGPWMASRLV